MAPNNNNTPPPDKVVRFNISLEDVEANPMVHLAEQQQRRQMSEPFECSRMHWLLAIEKLQPSNGGNGFDYFVVLYCLNVPVADWEDFPLKGTIIGTVPRDGQVPIFNARTGQAFNLVGKPFPADGVFMDGFVLTLRSGETRSDEAEVSMYSEEGLGGYYGPNWRGSAAVLLENHVYDGVRDGAAIEIVLRFENQPKAVRFVDQDE